MAAGTLTLGGIQYEIVAVDKTKDGIDTAKDNLKGFEKENKDTLSNIIDDYGVLALEVTAALVLIQQAYAQTVGVAIAYQDQIDDMHNTLGISIEDAQKWRAAAIATDTDLSSVTMSLRYLTQRISDAGTTGENLRATLNGIGVDAKDANGEYKNASDLLHDILLALDKIPAGADRARVASEIFGPRNWARMADMIENADAATQEFQNTHASMTEEESERIEKFKIKWAQLDDKINLAKADVGLFFIEFAEKYKVLDTPITGDWDIIRPDSPLGRLLNLDKRGGATSGAGGRSGDIGATGGADDGGGPAISQTKELGTATKNLYLDLSDTAREIKYQSEVVIPRYEEALKKAEEAGTGVAEAQYNLANAYDRLADLQTQDTDQTKAQVDAYKEYKSAVEDLNDAKEKLYDLDQDFAMDMQNAGMDVAAGRRAYQSYTKQRRGLVEDLGEAQLGVTEAATEFNAVQAGTPLEQIKGTEQYEKAQATTIGQITIENINLSQDYTANDFMNDLTAGRIAKGVPLAR